MQFSQWTNSFPLHVLFLILITVVKYFSHIMHKNNNNNNKTGILLDNLISKKLNHI